MDEREKEKKIEKIALIFCAIVLTVIVLMAPLAIIPEEYVHNLFSREGLIAYIIGFIIFPLPHIITITIAYRRGEGIFRGIV